MSGRYRLTDVETVVEAGSWVFTVRDEHGGQLEVLLVPCRADTEEGRIEAWVNRCTHEAQRLHRPDVGAVIREGELVCPKHGSFFDTCTGYCSNGEAAETTLPSIDITVDDGQVYLTDDAVQYLHAGVSEPNDEQASPSSTSHLQF